MGERKMRKRKTNTVVDNRCVEVGKYYRRHDGCIVEVLAIAERDSEPGTEVIVYRTRHSDLLAVDEKLYCCDAEHFLSYVNTKAERKPRYREVLAGTVSLHDAEWEALLDSSPMRHK